MNRTRVPPEDAMAWYTIGTFGHFTRAAVEAAAGEAHPPLTPVRLGRVRPCSIRIRSPRRRKRMARLQDRAGTRPRGSGKGAGCSRATDRWTRGCPRSPALLSGPGFRRDPRDQGGRITQSG